MRRIGGIILLAVALLFGSFMLTSANAHNNDDDNGGESFKITTVAKQFKDIDLPPKGESLGDQIVFSDDVYYGGKVVGSLDGFCTLTRLDPKANEGHQQCLVTVSLPKGTLASQGVIVFRGEEVSGFTIAITGGTGRYSDAGGEAHVEFVSDTRTNIHVVLDD
jgi:hypothetical protein